MVKVRLESIGCRLNIGEVEALGRQLAARGHRIVPPGVPADLVVFNTCTVTAMASRKSRHVLAQLKRANPQAAIVVTGCYAELEPEKVRGLGIDLVVGNQDKDHLAEILAQRGLLAEAEPETEAEASAVLAPREAGRTRAFLKVQDGCDNRCTFCVVTLARGAGRSRLAHAVAEEVRELLAAGYREIVLSGVHLGSWGRDLEPRQTLPELVRHLLEHTPVERLRLSSVEPWDLGPEFFEVLANPRVQPHLHLPLQSGSNAVLARMARRTTRAEFAALVAAARRAVPDIAISTDVIVGFPGESEAEFAESLELVERLAFSHLHVFRFSPRSGTRAATLPGQIPGPVAAERSRRMLELGDRLEHAFRSRLVGRTLDVLWEQSEAHGEGRRWSGLTGAAVRVVAECAGYVDLSNLVTPTEILHTVPGGLQGRPATPWSPLGRHPEHHLLDQLPGRA